MIASIDFTLGNYVENLTLVGSANLRGTGSSADNVLRGNAGSNVLDGGSGDDSLFGDSGNDSLIGGSGNDSLSGDSGDDGLDAGAGNDYLSGGSGNDSLDGGSGTDVLQGGSGDDKLRDASGASVLDGGAGADTLHVEGSASFLAGGKGNDVIEASSGAASVIAHNVGDGNDVVRASTQRVTVSLGGQLKYDDLKLHKDGANLVMETGSGDSTTFEGWYDAGTAKPQYLTLQVMTAAMDGFDAAGSDQLLNQRVQQFDLKALADAYDTDRMNDPTLDRWSMMHELLDDRLGDLRQRGARWRAGASLCCQRQPGGRGVVRCAGHGRRSRLRPERRKRWPPRRIRTASSCRDAAERRTKVDSSRSRGPKRYGRARKALAPPGPQEPVR